MIRLFGPSLTMDQAIREFGIEQIWMWAGVLESDAWNAERNAWVDTLPASAFESHRAPQWIYADREKEPLAIRRALGDAVRVTSDPFVGAVFVLPPQDPGNAYTLGLLQLLLNAHYEMEKTAFWGLAAGPLTQQKSFTGHSLRDVISLPRRSLSIADPRGVL